LKRINNQLYTKTQTDSIGESSQVVDSGYPVPTCSPPANCSALQKWELS